MSESFTWFSKLTKTAEMVPEEQRGLLLWALAQYGTEGIEPELEYPLNMAFEALREDIDNSKHQRSKNKGGRPRKTKDTEQKTQVFETENLGFENENPGFENKKPMKTPVFENENLRKPIPNQTIPNQTIPNQTIPNQTIPNQTIPNQEREAIRAIVAYLNAQTGKHFKASASATAKPIKARLAEGYTVDDFKRVIDAKCVEWLGTKTSDGRDMTVYLRPETLFGSKFEGYLNSQGEQEEGERFAEYD